MADISNPPPKMTNPMTIILTSPTRSPIRPPATSAAPNARLYAVIVQVCADRPSPRSALMVGNAGPITVENICAISAPNPIAARIAHAALVAFSAGTVVICQTSSP